MFWDSIIRRFHSLSRCASENEAFFCTFSLCFKTQHFEGLQNHPDKYIYFSDNWNTILRDHILLAWGVKHWENHLPSKSVELQLCSPETDRTTENDTNKIEHELLVSTLKRSKIKHKKFPFHSCERAINFSILFWRMSQFLKCILWIKELKEASGSWNTAQNPFCLFSVFVFSPCLLMFLHDITYIILCNTVNWILIYKPPWPAV